MGHAAFNFRASPLWQTGPPVKPEDDRACCPAVAPFISKMFEMALAQTQEQAFFEAGQRFVRQVRARPAVALDRFQAPA